MTPLTCHKYYSTPCLPHPFPTTLSFQTHSVSFLTRRYIRVVDDDDGDAAARLAVVQEERPPSSAWSAAVGARCTVQGRGCGTVRWIGDIDSQHRVGVELDGPNGLNDGSTPRGKTLFGCKPKHGIFVKLSAVEQEAHEEEETEFGFGI
jgi:hypothetical protein